MFFFLFRVLEIFGGGSVARIRGLVMFYLFVNWPEMVVDKKMIGFRTSCHKNVLGFIATKWML